jgi:hypothetical protein
VIDHQTVAVEHVGPAERGRRGHHLGDGGGGCIGVVGAQEVQVVAGGPTQALVERVGDAGIGLARPQRQPRAVAAEHLHRAVGRGAVDHPVLDRRVGLGEDAVDGVADGRGGIADHGDDREPRRLPGE